MGKGQRCVVNRNVSTYKSKTVKIKWKSSFQKKKKEREELWNMEQMYSS